MQKYYLRLILPTPLWEIFDYLPAEGLDRALLSPGIRIKVPFGKREVVGILWETADHSSIPSHKLKKISEVLDTESLLPPKLLQLCLWASDYYHTPLGEIVFNLLPKKLREGKRLSEKEQAFDFAKSLGFTTSRPKHELNEHQKKAVAAILSTQEFKTFMLAGITGSGKTEVYFHAIEKNLEKNQQILFLVPEIALTPQTLQRFQERFQVPITLLHSGLTEKERLQVWLGARTGQIKIIIGTRSAIFTPLKNPGMIILDEEHDSSFKQQSGFRYSARDLAIVRAQLENIPVVLGSATPSLESLYNAERTRYHYLELPKRAGEAQLPAIHIINLCGQKLEAGLSPFLLQTMEKHLKDEGQVLLFLNRRGFAPILLCHQCGYIVNCRHCDARLTLHRKPARLHCHHCMWSRSVPEICDKCQQKSFIPLGLGTERIEQVLQKIFPQYPILRIDRDSVRNKNHLQDLLKSMHEDKASIMIGTQMLAKGHHLPRLSLVAVVDADSGLLSTDFRATERMGQLLMQVAGRAGREKKQGEVYIQTHHPEHPMLKLLLQKGYLFLAKTLLEERKIAQMPPFAHMALLRAEASQPEQALHYLEEVKQFVLARKEKEMQVWGPLPSPMERKAGRYRAQLILQSANRKILQSALQYLSRRLSDFKSSSKVRYALDVDPQDML